MRKYKNYFKPTHNKKSVIGYRPQWYKKLVLLSAFLLLGLFSSSNCKIKYSADHCIGSSCGYLQEFITSADESYLTRGTELISGFEYIDQSGENDVTYTRSEFIDLIKSQETTISHWIRSHGIAVSGKYATAAVIIADVENDVDSNYRDYVIYLIDRGNFINYDWDIWKLELRSVTE